MVDRGLKVALALGILAGGTAGALLFRRPPSQPGLAVPAAAPPLVLRERGAAGLAVGPLASDPADPLEPPVAVPRQFAAQPLPAKNAPTVLAPLDPGALPPIMAKSYPRSPEPSTPRWGTSVALGPADSADPQSRWRSHTISDGDTLEAIAERYLGGAGRAMEIYEANRFVLPGPEVLPIGVELRIPPPGGPAEPSADPPGRGPLVPIPPSVLSRPLFQGRPALPARRSSR